MNPLQLRPARLSDASTLLAFELANRSYFERHIDSRGNDFYHLDAVRRSLHEAEADHAAGSAYRYLVWQGDTLIGRCNLTKVERLHFHSASLGYRIGEQHAGRGLASEAVRQCLQLAFGEHRLWRIEATVFPANVGSQRVLLKNAFNQYGHAQRCILHNSQWQDLLLFERHAKQ